MVSSLALFFRFSSLGVATSVQAQVRLELGPFGQHPVVDSAPQHQQHRLPQVGTPFWTVCQLQRLVRRLAIWEPVCMTVLRANSPVRAVLEPPGVEFLDWAAGAFIRLLPHSEIDSWAEIERTPVESVWDSPSRDVIRVTIPLGPPDSDAPRSIQTRVRRRSVPGGSATGRVLDSREYDICRRIALRIAHVLNGAPSEGGAASLSAIRDAFDEQVIAEHVRSHHGLDLDMTAVFDSIHELAEQTYENSSLTFGGILDPHWVGGPHDAPVFPRDLFSSKTKKYKALSDGFRTAYHITSDGHLSDFVDLEKYSKSGLSDHHYFPEWARDIARASRDGRCGICLSRQGDILVFDEGTLRFTYRYGQWQYWNHGHLLTLLKSQARTNRVSKDIRGKVRSAVYRAALDISFRRSGGMFVVLQRRANLRHVVPDADVIGHDSRRGANAEFDALLTGKTIQSLPRAVIVELASIDGAVVVDSKGTLLAFGAVLQPRRRGNLIGTEGSRTKAAIGVSNYGLAVKISADGAITVYQGGRKFFEV